MTRATSVASVYLVGVLILSLASATAAHAKAVLNGSGEICHKMLILRVVDGDTVYGYIDTSDPIVAVRAKLRLTDVDAPESGWRASCPAEAEHAGKASAYVRELLSSAIATRTRSLARACGVKRGKYALRRIGRLEVRLNNGWIDLGGQLVKKGYAMPSDGRRKGKAWCDCLESGTCPSGTDKQKGVAGRHLR